MHQMWPGPRPGGGWRHDHPQRHHHWGGGCSRQRNSIIVIPPTAGGRIDGRGHWNNRSGWSRIFGESGDGSGASGQIISKNSSIRDWNSGGGADTFLLGGSYAADAGGGGWLLFRYFSIAATKATPAAKSARARVSTFITQAEEGLAMV